MDLNSIYKNKPYLFSLQNKDKENEQLAKEILLELGYDNVGEVIFLDSSLDFDFFKAEINGAFHCFKYSLDTMSPFFSHEYSVLKQLTPFSPVAIRHGIVNYGDKIQYLLTSFENAESVKDFGVGILWEHWENFCYAFSQFSKVKTDRTFLQFVDEFFRRNDIQNLPEHSISAIKDHSNIENLKSVLSSLKSEIEYLSRQSIVNQGEFCHGRLTPENILTKKNLFKFHNIYDGYEGHCFLDLAYLFINLGMPLEVQREVAVDYYRKFQKEKSEESLISDYNFCYNLMLRFFVYESIFVYLSEVYLYENSRPEKILQMVGVFLRNEEALINIPSIQKNKEFLMRDIMEPLIGSNK